LAIQAASSLSRPAKALFDADYEDPILQFPSGHDHHSFNIIVFFFFGYLPFQGIQLV